VGADAEASLTQHMYAGVAPARPTLGVLAPGATYALLAFYWQHAGALLVAAARRTAVLTIIFHQQQSWSMQATQYQAAAQGMNT
jgi:hypothetical protein